MSVSTDNTHSKPVCAFGQVSIFADDKLICSSEDLLNQVSRWLTIGRKHCL